MKFVTLDQIDVDLLTTFMNCTSGMSGVSTFMDPWMTPCTTSLSCIPPTPASAACFAHAIIQVEWSTLHCIIFHNHEPPKDAVKWLSLLTRGLLRITAQETLSSTRKAISLHLLAVRGCEILYSVVCFILLELWLEQSKLQRNQTLKRGSCQRKSGSPANGEQQLRECGT